MLRDIVICSVSIPRVMDFVVGRSPVNFSKTISVSPVIVRPSERPWVSSREVVRVA